MIAVDTSAVIAILWDEKDAGRVRERLARENTALLSAGSALELQMVLAGAGALDAWDEVIALFSFYRIALHPFDEAQLAIAREAALCYGKGRHKARLNFGDCFAYALAKSEGLPLLCIGKDFAQTDIALA